MPQVTSPPGFCRVPTPLSPLPHFPQPKPLLTFSLSPQAQKGLTFSDFSLKLPSLLNEHLFKSFNFIIKNIDSFPIGQFFSEEHYRGFSFHFWVKPIHTYACLTPKRVWMRINPLRLIPLPFSNIR